MLPYWRSWFDAWVESAYGSTGFWLHHRPDQHFRTAAGSTPLLAGMVAELLRADRGIARVVDVGAGNGDLLAGLAEAAPRLGLPDLKLLGIDLRERPAGLPDQVDWVKDSWDVRYGRWGSGAAETAVGEGPATLLICCEWLDDLPCPVVRRGPDGWRYVVVDDSGAEQQGPRLHGAELDWADRWWPHGERAEIGTTRDAAWVWAVRAARRTGGAALLIDYGHLGSDRPLHGSFTGYREGRRIDPVPAHDVNLTAHVAVDALRAAGEACGAVTRFSCLQQEAMSRLLRPSDDPDPVLDLARRSQQSALGSAYVWGSHWWLLQG